MAEYKIYLTSFYSSNLYGSYIRFSKQAESLNIFDHILIYNEYNIPKDNKFDKYLLNKLVPSRGFGYWCWKPFIVLKTLECMNENDILIYLDIGCHINESGIDRLNEYLKIVENEGALCFELPNKEKYWTKSDLFNYFDKLNDSNITDTSQIMATIFILQKNNKNIEMVNKWLNVYYDDFSLTDDTPSKIANLEGFIENRHDQSIFSILSKMYDLHHISYLETETRDNKYPFIALRDKMSIYDYIMHNSCMVFINKVAWLIPIKNIRNNTRNKCIEYSITLIKNISYNENNEFDNIVGLKFIDHLLKYFINKKIISYINANKDILNKHFDYLKNIKNRCK